MHSSGGAGGRRARILGTWILLRSCEKLRITRQALRAASERARCCFTARARGGIRRRGRCPPSAMAGTAMAVPLVAGEEAQPEWRHGYSQFKERQKAQQAWLADFDRGAARSQGEGGGAAGSDLASGKLVDQGETAVPVWRRALGLLCVIGIPVFSTASAEFGQYMEMRLMGGSYAHGYVVSWANHSILIIFLIPWAVIVAAEKGCSCSALWKAMVGPYGTTKRLVGVTFWLSFQYQLFNCEDTHHQPRPTPQACV